MNKKLFIAMLLPAVLATGLAGPSFAQESLVTIGAAPLGGTYYPAALALSEIIRKHVPDMEARVEVTGGTMDNPLLLQQGELQLGLANADIAYFAHNGMAPFTEPFDNLRAMFVGLAPGVVQYAVLEESGVTSVKDLAGKRAAVGPQGNSSGLLFAKVLEFYGMDPGNVTRSYVSFSDGVAELLDGHVDMAVVQAGLPAPGLQEAFATSRNVRIISFPEQDRDAFLQRFPYYIPVTIPQETYPKLPGSVTTFATQNMVLVHKDMDPDAVYAMTKAVFEHLPDLYAAHPSLRSVTLETAAHSPIPLHEGALRYFRETGAVPKQ